MGNMQPKVMCKLVPCWLLGCLKSRVSNRAIQGAVNMVGQQNRGSPINSLRVFNCVNKNKLPGLCMTPGVMAPDISGLSSNSRLKVLLLATNYKPLKSLGPELATTTSFQADPCLFFGSASTGRQKKKKTKAVAGSAPVCPAPPAWTW